MPECSPAPPTDYPSVLQTAAAGRRFAAAGSADKSHQERSALGWCGALTEVRSTHEAPTPAVPIASALREGRRLLKAVLSGGKVDLVKVVALFETDPGR